ncbi:hypothetical protein V1511DRAFT_496955 [Dipodascopsis uninucleata]
MAADSDFLDEQSPPLKRARLDVQRTGPDAQEAVFIDKKSLDYSDGFEIPKAEVKRKKRKEKRRSRLFPSFDVNSSSVTDKINVADIRDLVLWILADGIAPKWLSIYNKLGIKHVAVLLIPGLTPDIFGVAPDACQPVATSTIIDTIPKEACFFKDHFEYLWPTRAPGDRTKLYSPSTTFMNAPLPKSEKSARDKKTAAKQKAGSTISLSELLMSPVEFIEREYPIHSQTPTGDEFFQELRSGWVETISNVDSIVSKRIGSIVVEGKYKVFGLDCEMCITTHGSALTRATLVNWDREVILDELIKPEHQITDYLTRFSGITEKLLEKVTTKLEDVQQRFLSIVSSSDILVGHSLENDFNALHLRHPNVIDTSIIYHHTRGWPSKPSLKWLASKYLKREIQQATEGHDSAEDARTCIDLVKLKLEKGLEFGTFVPSTEPLLRRLTRAAEQMGSPDASHRTGKGAIVDYGNPAQWYGTEAQTILSCKNDDEVVDGIMGNIDRHDFLFARLRELEFNRGWIAYHGAKKEQHDKKREDSQLIGDQATVDDNTKEKSLSECLSNLDLRLEKIWKNLPPATAFIVMSGTGDPREMSSLNAIRAQFTEEFKRKKWDDVSVKWTDIENQKLLEATKIARSGVSFLAIKGPPGDGE